MDKPIALILGGGGARAAYQIGVLKALVQFYPRNHSIPFKIISGTSAGAINATSIATHASCFHLGVKKLEWVWSHMQTSHIYDASIRKVCKHLLKMLFRSIQHESANTNASSLFNNDPLRVLLSNLINLPRIDRNIYNGTLTALNIDTSSYSNASSVSFFQAQKNTPNWQRARRYGYFTKINIDHLLASSAIPLVFPSIKIHQDYFGDGSVHQSAPLSAPIHLGAKKIMVINLDSPHKSSPKELNHHPKTATIAGHLLDTIFSDTLNSDLERLERVNQTIKYLPPDIAKEIGLHSIDTFVIKPSEDLSALASHYYPEMPFAVKTLLKFIGINQTSDSSIISYLLFESQFTKALINLGYKDAMAQIDELLAFFAIK